MQKQRVIVYIDGYNLYYGMRADFGNRYMWLDLQAFSESLLQPYAELVAVKYFTAITKLPVLTLRDHHPVAALCPYRGILRMSKARESIPHDVHLEIMQSRVFVLYTGGTIGMPPRDANDPASPLQPRPLTELLVHLPRFYDADGQEGLH